MKRILLTLTALLCTLSLRAQRTELTISNGWYFHQGEIAPEKADPASGAWTRVNLPHTWNRYDAFDETPGYYRGVGWYAYGFIPNGQWKDRRVILHFEGANQVAEVFVNGTPVGSHTGGYTAFNFDITRHLEFGKKNIIKVRLDNKHDRDIPPLNADFTFYGGIYRNVKLIAVDPVHFDLQNCASEGVFVETPSVDSARATVVLRGDVVNSGDATRAVRVKAVLRDRQGAVVGEAVKAMTLRGGSKNPFRFDGITIRQPHLWSPETPYLYTAEFSVEEAKGAKNTTDRIEIPFGVRWFSFSGDGFQLNGRKYPLKGTNRHQDFAGLGNALGDDYHRNDYRKIKSLGFNFVRLAHYPQAPEVYRMCDELGLLVWTEIPVVNEVTPSEAFTRNALSMMREQIRQTYNHPSVILYGYMNEILIRMLSNKRLTEEQRQQVADDTRALALKLEALTEEEAPDRNTVMAIHYEDGYNRYEVSTIPDVVGYNLYFGWYYEQLEDLTRYLTSEHARYPDRPIIVSECGADADLMNHSQVPRSWDYSEEYQVVLHHSYLKQFARMPFLAGYALWNFADFGAEARADATPWINQKGLVTYDRKEKDVTSLYRANLLETPLVYIASRNYTRRADVERQPGIAIHTINVFGNGREIELSVNGESLGSRPLDGNMATFSVPFRNGINRLEATDDRGVKDFLDIDFTVVPRSLKTWKGNDLAVNVGSYQATVAPGTGVIWIPDQVCTQDGWGRIGGKIRERIDRQHKVGISQNILGTDCNPLYQTFAEGIEGYRFDVADGTYRITLCFVESNPKSPTEELIYNLSGSDTASVPAGVRQFSVAVNGRQLLDNLNLARDYGNLRAVDFSTEVTARNNSGIEVAFTPNIGKTTLSGIRIERIN